jgi:hypothetical protein
MLPFPLTATRTRIPLLALALAASPRAIAVAVAAPKSSSLAAELELSANTECTTRADLMARVHARSPRVTFVDHDSALVIRARFSTLHAGAVVGELTLARPGATPSSRRVVAPSCAEAADAVALIIAVTLDPTSAEYADHGSAVGSDAATPDARSDEPANTNSNDASAHGVSPAPPPAKPKTSAGDAGSVEDEPSAAPGAAATTASSSRTRFGFVVAGQTLFGPAPAVMPGVSLYGTVGLDRPELFSPAVTLGATHAWRSGIEEPGGTASFLLDALSVDVCPLRVRVWVLEAWPCASVLGGRFSGSGAETQNPASESGRPFWLLGGAAVVSAPLVWQLEASARVGLGANLVRDSFEFSPVVFHTVAPVTLAASLGLGVRSH